MNEKVKILLIIPIKYDKDIERDIINEISNYNTDNAFDVNHIFLEDGPKSIETMYDEEIASYEVLKIIKNNLKNKYDSYIIDCFLGPGVDAARELTNIPVLYPGEIALYTAMILGNSFAFVDVLPESIPISLRLMRKLGVLENLSTIINLNTPVLDLPKNKEKIISLIVENIKNEITKKYFGSIVLGCTELSSIAKDIQDSIEKEGYYIPVINPLLVSMNFSLFLKRMGLKYSRVQYPKAIIK